MSWKNESRSADEYIEDVVYGLYAGSVADLARDAGLNPTRLREWLRDRPSAMMQWGMQTALQEVLGIPRLALQDRYEPIGEVLEREARATKRGPQV